jgi:hypothetical protein
MFIDIYFWKFKLIPVSSIDLLFLGSRFPLLFMPENSLTKRIIRFSYIL